MNEIDKLHLMADLTESFCELNHGPDTKQEDYPASDYIIMPFGYKENDLIEVAVREMVIPICYDCAVALTENDWTLVYCFECNSSQWISRKHSKMRYRHHILWLRGCPECSTKCKDCHDWDKKTYYCDFTKQKTEPNYTCGFKGLYFTDQQQVITEPKFLSKTVN